jgi:hypothetical protein
MLRTIGLLAIAIVAAIALVACGGDDSSVERGQPPTTDLLIRERTASRSASRFPDEGFQTIVRLQPLGGRADVTWRQGGPGPGATRRVKRVRVPSGAYLIDALAVDTFAGPSGALLEQCGKGLLLKESERLTVAIVHDLGHCRVTLR